MANILSDLFKWPFLSVILIYVVRGNAELKPNRTDLYWFDFEQMKRDLFTLNRSSEVEYHNFTTNGKKCLIELNAIGNGLEYPESQGLWAMKLLDAWGKIPSALFDGNTHDFGEFSKCFQIERNGELYKTKYCLGHLKFDLENVRALMTRQSNKHYNETQTTAPVIGQELAIVFGLCVPSICPLDVVQHLMQTTESIDKHLSIMIPEQSCQFEEIASELRTLDWVTIILLASVFILIAMSTSYDILCTVYKRDKQQMLLAFSFYSNGMKLLSYKKNKSPDMMHCLHGIRALSTQWIVLAHTFYMYLGIPLRNETAIPEFLSKYHSTFILAAGISVDTFFVLSGLLVSINMLKHFEKTNGKINIPLLYLHRYLRLTPLLGVSFLFSMTLYRFLGDGPIWPGAVDYLSQPCDKYWWSTLLYVQNYVNPGGLCFGHSWYLSVDMQLFLISPFIIFLIYRFETKALLVSVAFILGCMWCIITVHIDKEATGIFTPRNVELVHIPTHLRYSTWLIGVIAGYIFVKAGNKSFHIPRTINLFAWLLSLVTMAAVLLVNYPLQQLDSKNEPVEFGIYDAVSRVVWAIALCYIIFACVHGSGGPIDWFLAHPLWQPISRVCYATYLVHFPVVLVMTFTLKAPVYMSEFNAFHAFIGNYVLSIFVAIFATLAFESPIVVIEKIVFSLKKKPDPLNENGSHNVQNDRGTKPNGSCID